MKTLASEIKTAAATLNAKGAWARLYEVTVDDTTTLYFTDYPQAIVYQGRSYSPYPIQIGDIEETTKPEMKTFTIGVANIDRQLISYLESGKILGRNIKVTWILIKND